MTGNDFLDAALGETRRIGDLLLCEAAQGSFADQVVTGLNQALHAADVVSQLSKSV